MDKDLVTDFVLFFIHTLKAGKPTSLSTRGAYALDFV